MLITIRFRKEVKDYRVFEGEKFLGVLRDERDEKKGGGESSKRNRIPGGRKRTHWIRVIRWTLPLGKRRTERSKKEEKRRKEEIFEGSPKGKKQVGGKGRFCT